VIYARILVPLDGSERALAACGPARRLARLHGATLGLVTVAGPDATSGEINAIIEAGRLAMGDVATEAVVVRGSDPASTLARYDREHPETLLCLTTRARRPLGRALLGSVASEVVRESDQVVVLVGPRCESAHHGEITRLIVCLDGTSEGEVILSWATRWSAAASVPILLVRVVYPLVAPVARIPPTEAQIDELGYLRRIALQLQGDGYQVADMTVQHASSADVLMDLAADIPDALLAVSTATAGLADVVDGSVAAEVVRGSSVPVMVARHV
jgi:nucleotide-binding universal stress UspA family protein